jgi:hypothetical protein
MTRLYRRGWFGNAVGVTGCKISCTIQGRETRSIPSDLRLLPYLQRVVQLDPKVLACREAVVRVRLLMAVQRC